MGRGYSTTYAIVWDLLKKGNRFKQKYGTYAFHTSTGAKKLKLPLHCIFSHRLFTDNYYTSRRLWENLYWKKVFCCGTVKVLATETIKYDPCPHSPTFLCFREHMAYPKNSVLRKNTGSEGRLNIWWLTTSVQYSLWTGGTRRMSVCFGLFLE